MRKWLAARGPIRVLLTCALALAFLLPSYDSCICAADFDQNGSGNISLELANYSVGTHAAAKQGDTETTKGVPCQFCHCYHWVGVARTEHPTFGATLTATNVFEPATSSAPTAPTFSLLRPPRA